MNMSGRRLGTLVVAVMVLSGACGGKKSAVSTTSTVPPGSSTTATSAAPATTAKPGAGGGTATTAKPGTTTTTTARSSSGARPVPPQPGQYVYALSGVTSLQSGDRPITGQATLTVKPLSGTDQHQLRDESNQTVDRWYRFQADGVYLVDLKQTPQGSTTPGKEFKADPPVLNLPLPATVGKSWEWDLTSTDGATRNHGVYKVAGTETVTIGGEAVPCVVVDHVVTTSGDVDATVTSTVWISAERFLVVQQHDVVTGTSGPATFKSDKTSKLLSMRPS